jgi:N-sulfoglucosamine sulfohydrolase
MKLFCNFSPSFAYLAMGAIAVSFLNDVAAAQQAEPARPNILWLDAEDANVNWFGCYGNPAVRTPNIDRLAAEGFRYAHAFANAPVCAPSRGTWITGMHALSIGITPMRSRNAIPHERIRYYPDYLREAGYFAIQPGKTDYNIGGRPDRAAWHRGADWNDRAPDQPFFYVAHFNHSHESRAFGDIRNPRHNPARQRLRAYHPDIPAIRLNYAHYADAVQQMDAHVGRLLQRLEADGLAEDTIVIFTTDHGGVMPGSKRFLTDSGIHAPFIVRIPEKFKHLWPAEEPGMTVERLVSFVDMPKTWLSITGAEVPDYMQGRIFLGPDTEPEAEMHFAYTSRQAERFYEMRAVRTKDLLYIKNYKPYISTGQPLSFLWMMVASRAWEQHHRDGLSDEITGAFFQRRQPVERLFDVRNDPDNVINLVDHPDYQEELATLRTALREWQLEIRDSGILSEEEMARRASEREMTLYDLVRDPEAYPLERYLDAADFALAAEPANQAELISYLNDSDSGICYWGVIGLLLLEQRSPPALAALLELLTDEAHDVRALAAWALFESNHGVDKVRAALNNLLAEESYATLLVLNVIDLMNDELSHYMESVRRLSGGYAPRMRDYFENNKSWDFYAHEVQGGAPLKGLEAWLQSQPQAHKPAAN